MASTSSKSNYPQLLYAKGKAPSQQKSMHYYSYLSNFQMVEKGVAIDAWDALKMSSVGVIARFYEVDYTWCAKVVHYLLTNQLRVRKNFEIWSLVDSQPIRLSLIEFGALTGLNCEPFVDGDICDVDHTEFWRELGVNRAVGPNLRELQLVLERCKNWSFEKRRMVGWLCILHIGIYGMPPTSRIPLEVAKRVLDPAAFERYPWGRVACKSLIDSIKYLHYTAKKSYTMEGFVHVLLIWAYESIIGLGERYGKKIDGEEIPLLSWGGSRRRFEFGDFIREEKQEHENKVRVRHFLPQSDGNIVPKWEKEVIDEDVDSLVRDLLQDCVNPKAWGVIAAPISRRRKRKSAPVSDPEDRDDGDSSKAGENEMANDAVLTMLKTLTGKMDSMKTNLATKLLLGLDAAIDTKVKDMLAPFTEKIATLENEMEKMRRENVPEQPKETVNSNVNEEVSSKDMSWMVQMKSTSQNDLPIPCVVKNVKKEGSTKVRDKKAIKTERQVPSLLDTASGETWSDPIQSQIFGGVGKSLDAIAAAVNKKKGPSLTTPPPKRQTKLAPSQRFPFLGNSTVKRIIAGVIPSVTAYDPFADVDASKIQNLLAFQLDTEEKLDRTNTSSVEFYNVITTPREAWPNGTYGWLTNSHMWCAMQMFYQRSQCDPTPFHSKRIVFLDQWFVSMLVRDFKDFTPKKWNMPDYYKGVFNGTHPPDAATHRRWLHDVDHLYACHFVNNNHWIALDIDLGKETIHVYDSILTMVEDDKEIRNEWATFAKMIPAILNAMVPTCVRKRRDKQFDVRRRTSVPQNENPGDCGVYTIKYIECLAIGCTFEGLNDRNILELRRKLAADIYDEVGG